MKTELESVTECSGVKVGDTVTFNHDLISIGGSLLHAKGDKHIIAEIIATAGHWHIRLVDLWVEERINGIRLDGIYGDFNVRTFEETKHLNR